MTDRREIRDKLETFLLKYDKVFVAGEEPFTGTLFFRELSRLSDGNFLLLVSEENQDAAYACGNESQVISQEEYRYLEDLYYMYEFSDHLYMLADNDGYASLGNYVSGGILTEEEMVSSLLGAEK